jgi:hypothetical protein
VVVDLRVPLGLDVLEGGGGDDGKACQEDVCLGVRKRAKAVVILLSSGVPETQVNGFVVHHHVGRVVVKHGGDVVTREGVGCVRDEEASFPDGSVTDNDTLDGLHAAKKCSEVCCILCGLLWQAKQEGGGNNEPIFFSKARLFSEFPLYQIHRFQSKGK